MHRIVKYFIVFLPLIWCHLLSQKTYNYGITAIYNTTSLFTHDQLEVSSTKSGLGFGGYIRLDLDPNISFLIESHFIQKNFYYQHRYNRLVRNKYDGVLNFLSFPFTFQVRKKMFVVIPFIDFGIYLSLKLHQASKYVSTIGTNSSHDTGAPILLESESGVLIGIGVNIPVTDLTNLILGYRLSPALIEIGSLNSNSWKLKTNIFYCAYEL